MTIKVAIIHNIMAPYRFPLFNYLSKQKELDVTVYFLAKTAVNRKWDISAYLPEIKFKWKLLKHVAFTLPIKDKTAYLINPEIFSELNKKKFDIVITAGWLDFACHAAYITKKLFKHQYIIWSESTTNEVSWQRTLSKPIIKYFVKNADATIAIGTRSAAYLESLGAKKKDQYIAYSTVNTPYFIKKYGQLKNFKKELRKKYTIPLNHKVILYVGQFIERKNVISLLKSMNKSNIKKTCTVLLVGYGELEESYKQYAQANSINLHIESHKEIEQIIELYTLADVFVLPSLEETWGLVVNEAMACELPVVVSSAVGCAPDLVKNGENGYVYTSNNVKQLANVLDLILSDSNKRKAMGKKSLQLISSKSPEAAGVVFKSAIIQTVNQK